MFGGNNYFFYLCPIKQAKRISLPLVKTNIDKKLYL